MLKKIKIKNIKPNPFRNIDRYPIREEKVAALINSFKETGVWPVILGRERGAYVEIPFGHHRKEAWERSMKPSDEIDVNIMDLSDAVMIKMMAHENMEEWGTSAIVEIETISAVVQAYAEGKIELDGLPKNTHGVAIRYAPSFAIGKGSLTARDHPYTVESVAKFLGWMQQPKDRLQERERAQNKVYAALTALELIEEGILTEDHFIGLKSKEAAELVRETRARKEEREREAKDAEEQARKAKQRAEEAESLQARRLAQEQQEYAESKAQKARAKGKDEAQRVGKHLSSGMREGRIAATQARAEANKIIALQKRERELRFINNATRSLITAIDRIFDSDSYAEKLKDLTREAANMDYGVRIGLIEALEHLSERILGFAQVLRRVEMKQAKTATQPALRNGQ